MTQTWKEELVDIIGHALLKQTPEAEYRAYEDAVELVSNLLSTQRQELIKELVGRKINPYGNQLKYGLPDRSVGFNEALDQVIKLLKEKQ